MKWLVRAIMVAALLVGVLMAKCFAFGDADIVAQASAVGIGGTAIANGGKAEAVGVGSQQQSLKSDVKQTLTNVNAPVTTQRTEVSQNPTIAPVQDTKLSIESTVLAPPPVIPLYMPQQPTMQSDMSKKTRENSASLFSIPLWSPANIGAWALPDKARCERMTFNAQGKGGDIQIFTGKPSYKKGIKYLEVGSCWFEKPIHQMGLEKAVLAYAKGLKANGIIIHDQSVKLEPSESSKGVTLDILGLVMRKTGTGYLGSGAGGGLQNTTIGVDALPYVGYTLVDIE